MKRIPLTRGRVALVDDDDYDRVAAFRWNFDGTYARRLDWNGPGKKRNAVLMHRFILNAPVGAEVDHVSRDGLDNRKENLRLCSHAENMRNVEKVSHWRGRKPSSRFKGVYQRKSGKWAAQVRVNKKQVYLGTFDTEAQAAEVYRKAATESYGDFARVG